MGKVNLLNDSESAIYLGVTKELLYAYTNNSPKKCIGETRKLSTIVIDGQNYFKKEDLDSFDTFLKEPWSNSADQRPPIPSYIKEYLKVEIQGKCPISNKGYPLEYAHIVPYSESLNHHHHNIIRIAGEVHSKVDNGIISRDILTETKNKLINSLRTELLNAQNRNQFKIPKNYSLFVGRDNQLLELFQALNNERLIIVEGIGGIGKTQFVLKALNQNCNFNFNTVIWIDIESIESYSDFLILLNNQVFNIFHFNITEGGIESLSDIHVTIVLDSLEKLIVADFDKIHDFISKILLGTNYVQILITTQIELSILDFPEKVFHMQGLNTEESICLFEKLLGGEVRFKKYELESILDFCNGHPLSLKLVISLIKYYKSPEYVIDIFEATGRLEQPNRRIHNKSSSLEVCIDTIYSILTDDQKQILQQLQYYPGGFKMLLGDYIFNASQFIENVTILKQFFFLEVEVDSLGLERVSIPNPMQTLLKVKINNTRGVDDAKIEIEILNNIMMEAVYIDFHYMENSIDGSLSVGISRIEVELPNFLYAFNMSKKKAAIYEQNKDNTTSTEYLKLISYMANSLGKFCFFRSYIKEAFIFSYAGIDASYKLQDYISVSVQYSYLAQIQMKMFDTNGLQHTVKKLEELSEQTNDEIININALRIKGHLNFNLYEYEQARLNFSEAVNLLEKYIEEHNSIDEDDAFTITRNSDFGNLLQLKSEVAKTYEFQHDYLHATKIYEDVIKIAVKIFAKEDFAFIYHHYANCLYKTGNYMKGIENYFLAIHLFDKTKQYDFLANSISDIGLFVCERYPEVINDKIFTLEVLKNALESITNQMRNLPNLYDCFDNNSDQFSNELIGKIIGLIKALSFSRSSIVLSEWTIKLADEFDLDFSKLNYLVCLLNLSHCIGGVYEWNKTPEAIDRMIKSILQTSLIINGGPDINSKTKLFYWLAQWLQFVNLQSNAYAEGIWKQAWDTFDE